MIPFTLSEAARAVSGVLYPAEKEITVTKVFTDSREACEGGLFCAIRGERHDGHDYVPSVCAAGGAALVDRKEAAAAGTILVDNVKEAVYRLADWYRREKCPHVKTVCITGSVGKTTTKDMTGLVFSAGAPTFVTPGNKNSLIGVPLSVLSIDARHEYAVLELGMSERGEIAGLSALARPYISLITVIGSSHIEALGSLENIKNEKFDILKGQSPDGKIILNADCELEYAEGQRLGSRAVFCSARSADAQFYAQNIKITDSVTSFTVVHPNGKTDVRLNLPGIHNVTNALLAFAAGVCCGLEPQSCADALASYLPGGNRQHSYVKDGVTVIADCYNASPESMAAALGVLEAAHGRRIAVLGDMLELGGFADELHRKVARQAAQAADVLIFVGDMAAIYAEAAKKECRTFGIEEKSRAADMLKEIIKQGDTVLFKASNRLHLEEIIKEAGL